eukprot:157300-Hanusia_phi.AAC.1
MINFLVQNADRINAEIRRLVDSGATGAAASENFATLSVYSSTNLEHTSLTRISSAALYADCARSEDAPPAREDEKRSDMLLPPGVFEVRRDESLLLACWLAMTRVLVGNDFDKTEMSSPR